MLGAFKCPLWLAYPPLPQSFLSSAFKYAPPHKYWPPILSAHHKADLAQADYSDKDIFTLADCWAALCARCLQWGHNRSYCTARIICINCSAPEHKAINCPARYAQNPQPAQNTDNQFLQHGKLINHSEILASTCHSPTQRFISCSNIRCTFCGAYRHVASNCHSRRWHEQCKWVPKNINPSKNTPDGCHSASSFQTSLPNAIIAPLPPPSLHTSLPSTLTT